jgi:hypothetical protein
MLLDDFTVDLTNTADEVFSCLECFFITPHPSRKVWEYFLPLSKHKKVVGRLNSDSWRGQEGTGTTPWVYFQGSVRIGLCVMQRAQRNGTDNLHRHGTSKDVKKLNSFYCDPVFPISVGTHLLCISGYLVFIKWYFLPWEPIYVNLCLPVVQSIFSIISIILLNVSVIKDITA